MRARAAYISSFGTTTILVASAVLMLALVGAIVGFHRWPSGTASRSVPSVSVAPPRAAPLSVTRAVRAALPAPRHPAGPRRHRRAAASTAGLVKYVPAIVPEVLSPRGPAPSAPAGRTLYSAPGGRAGARPARTHAPPPPRPTGALSIPLPVDVEQITGQLLPPAEPPVEPALPGISLGGIPSALPRP